MTTEETIKHEACLDPEPVKWAERYVEEKREDDDEWCLNAKTDLQAEAIGSDSNANSIYGWIYTESDVTAQRASEAYGSVVRARYITPEWKAWKARHDAKAKQEADGWTDEEIEKAAFKPKEWTDIPQVVTKRNNTDDSVTHPKHYTSHPSGIECIQVTEHMNFCLGCAVKYIWRAGLKGDAIEDLKKAAWYLDREIERRTKAVKK